MTEQTTIAHTSIEEAAWSITQSIQPLLASKYHFLEKIEKNGMALKEVPPLFKDDKEIVLSAVRRDGYALKYASNRLRHDRDIAIAAIENSPYAYAFIGQSLKTDPKIHAYLTEKIGPCITCKPIVG